MARRLRRPVHRCRLAGAIDRCHVVSGNEAACALCRLIDWDAPLTIVSLGLPIPPDPTEAADRKFWDHLARRHDGGPSNAAELYAWQQRRRARLDRETESRIRKAIRDQSPLPDEPPF